MSRHLIELDSVSETTFSELAEQKVEFISGKLRPLLGEGISAEAIAGIREQVVNKLRNMQQDLVAAIRSMETKPNTINAICIDAINTTLSLHLTREEMDYMLLLPMYQETHDANTLHYSTLLAHLKAQGCDFDQRKESLEPKPSAPSVLTDEKFILNENAVEDVLDSAGQGRAKRRFSDPQDLGQPLVGIMESRKPGEETKLPARVPMRNLGARGKLAGEAGMNEDQMIEVAQRCFYTIAEQMAQKKLSVFSLYEDVIFKKKIDGEEVELISPLDFLNGLRKLGIDDLQTLDYTCLIKVLAINETEKHIRVSDLVQILEDYGITERNSVEDQLIDELKFEDLDKVSMVLMLALTEYLVKAKAPLYDLFGAAIYKQEVQIDSKQLQVDLVNSSDFFAVLRSIGINTEEKEHENLKAFLCLDTSVMDKLMVKKIKRAIEEFAVNEELRAFAQKCYQELVDEDQLEDVPPEANKGAVGT